jgi:hypothetical protein
LSPFYFWQVTLTTVGYGDFHPKTQSGRIFSTIYILASYIILAITVYAINKQQQNAKNVRVISLRQLAAMDANGDGQLYTFFVWTFCLLRPCVSFQGKLI